MKAFQTHAEVAELSVLYWGHGNMLMQWSMVLLMAEYSGGTEINTDNRVVHKVHRDVWRSILELGAGPGDMVGLQKDQQPITGKTHESGQPDPWVFPAIIQ